MKTSITDPNRSILSPTMSLPNPAELGAELSSLGRRVANSVHDIIDRSSGNVPVSEPTNSRHTLHIDAREAKNLKGARLGVFNNGYQAQNPPLPGSVIVSQPSNFQHIASGSKTKPKETKPVMEQDPLDDQLDQRLRAISAIKEQFPDAFPKQK